MSGPAERAPLLILAGGKGTRLRALDPLRPKPMVLALGKPFLHWLIDHYQRLGYSRFIISTGYLAEQIEEYPWGLPLEFERETTLLGTGGAVQAIFKKLNLSEAWVLNGDTFLPGRLPEIKAGYEALFTALEPGELYDATPNLAVDGDLVISESPDGQYFDGGAVWVARAAVERYRGAVPCSLHELLVPAKEARKVGYAIVPGTCYDIGTPARHARFEEFLKGSHVPPKKD
jgi:NDP-sugar pyrophosphorylase family protein